MKIEHHEIKVDVQTFLKIMKAESIEAEGLYLNDIPVSEYCVIARADLHNKFLSRYDTLEIRPEKAVDGVTGLSARVLEVNKDSIKIVVTSKLLHSGKRPEPYEREPNAKTLDLAALETLHTRFNELQRNPFAVERELGHNRSTIYKYLNHDGTPSPEGQKVLNGEG